MAAKKERKERILYDNYYSEEAFSAAREELLENDLFMEDNGYESEDDIPDDEIFDKMQEMQEDDWDMIRDELEKFFGSHPNSYLVRGTVGLWYGNKPAGNIIHSLAELSYAWKDCEYIKLYDVDGHFYIKCSHHDGDNLFEMKMLTERGREYADIRKYDYHDRELHDRLWNDSHYTVLPHIAHTLFGVPKRESA